MNTNDRHTGHSHRTHDHHAGEKPHMNAHDVSTHAEHMGHAEHTEHAGHVHHAGHAEPTGHEGNEGHEGHTQHANHDTHHGHDDHAGHASPNAHAEHDSHAEHEGQGAHDGHAGHEGHGGHAGHTEKFRRLFFVMLAFAVPTIALSPMFAMIIGYSLPASPLFAWIPAVLGTVMYAWGGAPFLTGAVDEIKARKPGMMLLIGLAITVAFIASWGATLGVLSHQLEFWWELALLIVIMLLGHWIEMRSLAQTTSALDSLAALLPDEAERVDGDTITTVSPSDLTAGDIVIVRPGARVPADGDIVQGSAAMDESMITGESLAVRREVGDRVVAGTVATDSGVRVAITAVGDDTALAGIRRLVADAQASSSKAQRLADRAAGWLFWFALAAAVATAVVWSMIGSPEDAIVRTVTVLVIACPHALGLAIPLVVSIATEKAARSGVLVKDRLALESMRTIDTVVFDKTGTLTKGEPAVTAALTTGTMTEERLLMLAAGAEKDSEHPLARAIVRAAADRDLTVAASTDFSSSPAVGVRAIIDDSVVQVGGPYLLQQENLEPLAETDPWSIDGAIVLHVIVDGQVAGALRLADEIRPESHDAVRALHDRGITVVMITGDAQAVADSVAAELGIDRVFAGVRPEDKAAKIQALQREGHRVAMVGDGVNDAPALAQADVGLAVGTGTDVAIGSAGVILASDDPRAVLSVIELSRASYRKMKQNLWWAAGYNLLSVPLAAGVLSPWGIDMPTWLGAILMSLSTIVVAANAQLLRRVDLNPARLAGSSVEVPEPSPVSSTHHTH